MKHAYMKFLKPGLSLVLACAAISSAPADPLVPNGGFEDGPTGWTIFVPDESKDKNCRFDVVADAPHSGANCIKLESDDFARFSVGFGMIPVQAGERYRVSVWVRADPKAQVRPKAAGFAVRLNLRKGDADADGGHLFLGLGGRVSRNTPPDPVAPLPTQWTETEAVIEIPAGVDAIGPSLFSWWTSGSIYADDFAVEKVPASTPVTPLPQNPASPAATSTAAITPVTVTDADLLAALNLDWPGMEKVKAAAQPHDTAIEWSAVQSAYLDYRRNGSTARWRIMPSDKPVHPAQKDDPRADDVLAHHIRNGYHFQPAEADMGKDFNWTYNPVPATNPAFTDEWTYCAISRTEFWEALASAYWQTGDEKYAAGWVGQLRDFAAKNPMHFDTVPGVPSLWRSLDSSLRITLSWPDAYYHFLQSPSFTPADNWLYLKLSYEHAQLLLHVLSDTSRTGNWVVTECAGLYAIGTIFPEFRDAAAWRKEAIDRLSTELDRMVPPDGFEAELTPTYHFVSLDGFLRPLQIAQLNHQAVPENFRSRILAMYRAAVLVMDQNGHDVPTNDSSPVNAVLAAEMGLRLGDDPLLAWAASHGKRGEAPPNSTALPYAGFYAMRSGWKRDDLFLFFRGGPTGIGHQHEDMLEVVLRAWNKTLLFDPGTYTYDKSDWRRFTIGTASHNTIIVDGKWQHRGPNKPPVTQPTGDPWVTTPLFDYVAATYSAGYQESVYRPRPFDPQTWKGKPDKSVSHTRRVLFLPPYYALVLDTLDGTGKHTFDAHFHLDAPAARLDPKTHAAFSQNTTGAQLALYPLDTDNLAVDIVQGQLKPLLGWMPGEHRPIPTIRFRKEQAAPAIFATFLYPYRDKAPDFAATPLTAQGASLWSETIRTSGETMEIVLAKSGTATPFSLTSALLGDISTEATGLVIRQPGSAGVVYAGALDLHTYRDGEMELALDKPAPLLFSRQKDSLLLFNPTDADLTVTVKHPFACSVVLAPKTWTAVSSAAATPAPAPAPVLFKASDAPSEISYDDYVKSLPDATSSGTPVPIKIKASKMTVPANAVLAPKIGAEGPVLARWEDTGTISTATVDIPQSGWYRVKVRYCSGEEPVRSLLINGKSPFAEAEAFSLPSTIGASPSDGWSNFNDDWRETVLGSGEASPGWKIYLNKGPCTLDLRNDGSGMNLDWLELDPA